MNVVVVGGGIAGLAAAARVAAAGVDVTLLERSDRLGGSVRTIPFAGRALDVGAEMIVTGQPAAVDLCAQLGLGDDLVAPVAAPAHVWVRGRLRPLPAGLMGGLPGGVGSLLRSRILTPAGLLRASVDLVAPSHAPQDDVAIGAIVRDRLGPQVLDRLVEPMLGGIHAGRCDDLSAQALMPQAITALAGGRGLVRGLRAAARSGPGPAFVTLRHGLGTLVSALAQTLLDGGADVRVGVAATAVRPAAGGGVTVVAADGPPLHADACIVATPAPAAAAILQRSSPVAAAELARLGSAASAAVVVLAYRAAALGDLPEGTGFLTAAGEGRLVRACTWTSAKWSHLAGEPALLKAFVGRAGEPPPAVDDGQLAELVHAELAQALRLRERPVETHVERFVEALPQYAVGHLARVGRVDDTLPEGVELAGAAYRGVGIPACVRSGHAAADRLLERLGLPAPVPMSLIAFMQRPVTAARPRSRRRRVAGSRRRAPSPTTGRRTAGRSCL
ncbi:MAG: protoporphyrinogen/coproporphyrinogen oxidase [Solirubrobacteraceae bacterium]|nr:protoporphyrinogen/coproporphyrinogen oxidase [Solirubrobacteraceae bacterium]